MPLDDNSNEMFQKVYHVDLHISEEGLQQLKRAVFLNEFSLVRPIIEDIIKDIESK